MSFDWKFAEVCSQGSNWQYASIGLNNGFAPNRRPAIIWTNNDLDYWRRYASLDVNDLKQSTTIKYTNDTSYHTLMLVFFKPR